jgi:hypothetical protein
LGRSRLCNKRYRRSILLALVYLWSGRYRRSLGLDLVYLWSRRYRVSHSLALVDHWRRRYRRSLSLHLVHLWRRRYRRIRLDRDRSLSLALVDIWRTVYRFVFSNLDLFIVGGHHDTAALRYFKKESNEAFFSQIRKGRLVRETGSSYNGGKHRRILLNDLMMIKAM